MAALWGRALRRGRQQFNDARTISRKLNAHGFAGQGQRHEDLAAFVFGNSVALGAQPLDDKVDRLIRHERLQAVSRIEGQLRVSREG